MKIIQVPLEEKLLREIDLKAARFPNRSTFIRKAIEEYIRSLEEEAEADDLYAAGYKRVPEKKVVARAAARLGAKLMKKENW